MPATGPTPLDDRLRRFFETFARASDPVDPAALAGCFHDVFLAGDGSGATAVPRAAFLRALPDRVRQFAAAGLRPATLDRITHQELDEHYVLVRTEWTAARTDGGPPATLSSSFLLHRNADDLRIVAYLTHRGLPHRGLPLRGPTGPTTAPDPG